MQGVLTALAAAASSAPTQRWHKPVVMARPVSASSPNTDKEQHMPVIELSENKWGQVMSILADAPWKIANPLLMEIGEQLRAQRLAATPPKQTAPEEIKHSS